MQVLSLALRCIALAITLTTLLNVAVHAVFGDWCRGQQAQERAATATIEAARAKLQLRERLMRLDAARLRQHESLSNQPGDFPPHRKWPSRGAGEMAPFPSSYNP